MFILLNVNDYINDSNASRAQYPGIAPIVILLISCNKDDDNDSKSESSNPVVADALTPGADHTYEIVVTTGTFAGMTFSGTVPNETPVQYIIHTTI